MADEVVQSQDPEIKDLLKLLLADRAREIKERETKEAKEHEQRLARIEDEMKAATERNEMQRRVREGCIHQTVHPGSGSRRSAWRAQVNSDGTFVPLCGICGTIMPKILATDEQKKEGVGLDRYVELSLKALEGWHKKSYPEGCDAQNCYVCHPLKKEEAELVAV
jgi:hypothetical protein